MYLNLNLLPMKNHIYLIITATLLLSACSKKNDMPSYPPPTKAVIKDAGTIPFKIAPLADNQVQIFLRYDQQPIPSKIILKQDTNTLQTVTVSKNNNNYSAIINYAFKPGVKYNFKVQTVATSDTIRQFSINDYTHQFVHAFSYKKLLDLKQSMGPKAADISPSRNYLFIADDINNILYTKRLSLKTFAVDVISDKLLSTFVRAASDDELLIYGDKNTANVPPVTIGPGSDRIILAKYNINTTKSTFVDFVSSGYGRISRVVNNHVLVTNPIFEDKTASLVNLTDLSKVKYSLDNFDFVRINEYSANHILYANNLINTTNGSMSTPLNLDQNSGLIDIDNTSGYAFVGSAKENAAKDILTAFSVYKDGSSVYQSAYTYGNEAYFPVIANIKNDILTFYQCFNYGTQVQIDGYYTLNLKTKEIKLVQADSNSTLAVVSDYQLQDGSIISVRSDGVYRIAPAN